MGYFRSFNMVRLNEYKQYLRNNKYIDNYLEISWRIWWVIRYGCSVTFIAKIVKLMEKLEKNLPSICKWKNAVDQIESIFVWQMYYSLNVCFSATDDHIYLFIYFSRIFKIASELQICMNLGLNNRTTDQEMIRLKWYHYCRLNSECLINFRNRNHESM